MNVLKWVINLPIGEKCIIISIILVINCIFALLAARNVERLYDRTNSPEKAMARLRILNQYIHVVLMLISCFGIAFLSFPLFKELGKAGKAMGIFTYFLLVIVMLLLMQAVYYKPMRKIRGTTETVSEQLKNTLRVLIFIFLPMMIIMLVIFLLPEGLKDKAFSSVLGIIVFMVFILAINLIVPLFYKYMVKAVPMEPSELRETLSEALDRSGIKSAFFYVWPTKKSKLANAVVSGFGKKNIFISDYLMDNCTSLEIESIVAHEIGHIKKYHLWKRLFLSMIPIPVFALIGNYMDHYEEHFHTNIPVIPGTIGFLAVFLLYYGIVFHYFSRIQERHADAYVLEIGVNPSVYISALLKLAKLNHMSAKINKLDEKFQTHPSIARRVKWIEEKSGISYNPDEEKSKTI